MKTLVVLAAFLIGAASAEAQPCGGPFDAFLDGIRDEATGIGHSEQVIDRFLEHVAHDPKVIRADRAQGIFQTPFIAFSGRLVSEHRLRLGSESREKWAHVFDRIEREYGVSRGVLLALWGFETDFGLVQGDFNTVNSLVTLAHDCRRPELFRPQVLAAIELFERGGLDPVNTTGAWAGEVGMVQMLPEDILLNGVDGDGDGKVDLKGSPADALVSGARMLTGLGWRKNQPWLQEVRMPQRFDWSETGFDNWKRASDWVTAGVKPRSGQLAGPDLEAAILLPQGRNGPAFLAYPNFNVFLEWNKSFVYVITAAYFATRLEGAPAYNAGETGTPLDEGQVKALQRRLEARGHDVGGIDGILGAKTRSAVQKEQMRLGLSADAWPTLELLDLL